MRAPSFSERTGRWAGAHGARPTARLEFGPHGHRHAGAHSCERRSRLLPNGNPNAISPARGVRGFVLSGVRGMRKTKIVVVGAGAAGLLAALDLARAGNEVTILEARCRAGGRIYSLDPDEFGYPAQGGAEFVHGPAPLTREIAEEAGMTLSPRRGEVWNVRGDAITQDGGIVGWMAAVSEKLIALERDMTIAEFLTTYFGG